MYFTEYEAPLSIGTITVCSSGEGISDVWFEKDRYSERRHAEKLTRADDLDPFVTARDWLERYFAGSQPSPSELSLEPKGTEFQMLVRAAMLEIPYGETRTYGWIAKRIEEETGKPRSARAVGGAVGRNPLGIIVPCHRVMGAGGNLTGFGGGLAAKIALLEHEGVDMSKLKMPKKPPVWDATL